MEIKDRISEFIQYKNITIAEFERNVSLANGYIKKFKGSIGSDKLSNIISYYPDININWLITGEGSMLKSENSNMVAEPLVEYGKKQTKPRIPYTAAAGSLTSAVEGITADQCEQIPRINIFPEYDFTIIIKGDSMEPKYEGGDEVACKRIDSTSFIQWGKVHVLDTAQGILIKRTYEDGDKIRCVSYNQEYPDFSIDKSEIYSMSLVVGLVRL
jgi:repressor LexA|nr:MAG TPA_asm: Repressor protein CI [Caudoviricetes sp.]